MVFLFCHFSPVTAWAVRKDDQVLAAVLNQTLAAWEKNGRVADILGRWIAAEKAADASE